jgi:hypothetical protein
MFVCGTVLLFAVQEQWFSTGFGFGNSFEFSQGETAYIGAPGFNLNYYGFSNTKNIGVFFQWSMLFPKAISGNEEAKGYNLQIDFLVGTGFRYGFTEQLHLYGGIGLTWMFMTASYSRNDPKIAGTSLDYEKSLSNLGLGADIGVKYDVTDYFYISIGSTVSCLFISSASLYSFSHPSNDTSIQTRISNDWVKDYFLMNVKPYIGIGFNSYAEKRSWGKPKKN